MKKVLSMTLILSATFYITLFSNDKAEAASTVTIAPANSALNVINNVPANNNAKTVVTPVKDKKKAQMKKAIKIAMAQRGIPYVFGGKSTNGFDCSGLIDYALQKAGLKPGNTNAEGYYAMGKTVKTPKIGDLVFFSGTYKQGISHIGIYIGDDEMINASGDEVQVTKIHGEYWNDHFTGYKRIV